MRILSKVVFVLTLIFCSLSAMGQTPAPQVFQPAPPAPDKFDWIQLKSGEWLKGELIALYENSLEFDSDELNDLRLKWEDVRQVRTGRVVQVRFVDKELTGRLVIDSNTVQVVA